MLLCLVGLPVALYLALEIMFYVLPEEDAERCISYIVSPFFDVGRLNQDNKNRDLVNVLAERKDWNSVLALTDSL